MALVLGILQLILVATTTAQSSLKSCNDQSDDVTKCIIDHVTSKFDQQSVHGEMRTQQLIDLQTEFHSQNVDKLEGIENQESVLIRKIDDLSRKVDGISTNTESPSNKVSSQDFSCAHNASNAENDGASLPKNCVDILSQGHQGSGMYTIYVHNPRPSKFRSDHQHLRSMQVYCDMDISNGGPGWLVFQRRRDGSVSFARGWEEYGSGFGELNGEFWLGNDNLAILTGGNIVYELRIDLEDWEGEHRYALYDSFVVLSDASDFKLLLDTSPTGDAGNSFYVNEYKFSTPDRGIYQDCAQDAQTGFWHRYDCEIAGLNHPYHHNSTAAAWKGITWYSWHGDSYSLKFTEMKIRPLYS